VKAQDTSLCKSWLLYPAKLAAQEFFSRFNTEDDDGLEQEDPDPEPNPPAVSGGFRFNSLGGTNRQRRALNRARRFW